MMTIVFYYADGSHRILKPMRHITPTVIDTLCSDFKAARWIKK